MLEKKANKTGVDRTDIRTAAKMKFHAAFILLGGLFLLTSLGSAVPNIQSTTPENKVCPSYVCSGPIVRPISQNGACFCPLTLSKNVDTSHDAAFESKLHSPLPPSHHQCVKN